MGSLLCASVPVSDPAQGAEDAVAARDHGADLVEFRIDEFFSGTGEEGEMRAVTRLVSECLLPCIVTCRTVAEGGHYDGDEDARVSLFEHLARSTGKGQHPPRYIDVEFAGYSKSRNIQQKVGLAVGVPGGVGQPDRGATTGLILSMHDMATRPPDLLRRLAQMYDTPAASIVKVAYRARSLRDSLELLDLHADALKPTIALGMGEFGLLSRVLAPKFGGFLTFASLRAASATAPGQPTVRELLDVYRFRSINAATQVYGVIGYPVAQSLSPLVHNAGFDAAGVNAVYLQMPIAAGEDAQANDLSLKATLLELVAHPRLDLRGLSVTHPFKESVLQLAGEQGWQIDSVVDAIGAANTLHIPAGDVPRLTNTDAPAVRQCLEEVLDSLFGKRVAVIGAGGMARAAAFSTALAGASVAVFGRNADRAATLVRELQAHLPGADLAPGTWEALQSVRADAVVNCTTLGMFRGPSPGESPIRDVSKLDPRTVVFDTVYNPVQTPLLKAAAEQRLATVDGASLFIRQAAAQFELWTAHRAPAALFEKLVRERLARQDTR